MQHRTHIALAFIGILLITIASVAYLRGRSGDTDERAVRALVQEFGAQLRSDHFDIIRISPQGEGYVVQGAFVSKASEGDTTLVPVYFQVVKEGGKWKIAAYQEVVVPASLQ